MPPKILARVLPLLIVCSCSGQDSGTVTSSGPPTETHRFIENLPISIGGASGVGGDWHDQIQNAIDGWNKYGSLVTAIGYDSLTLIDSEGLRDSIVALITDPALAYFPSGDDSALSEYTAATVGSDPSIPPADVAAWQAEVDSKVQVGHIAATTEWSGFTTITIVDLDNIVYDNMFSHASGGGAMGSGMKTQTCKDLRLWWLWEYATSDDYRDYTRGSIWAKNTANCNSSGEVITCDEDCSGSMTAGQADVKCKSEQVEGEECCQMSFNWAWACGFKKINVAADGYTLEIEGIIGSSGSGNGSCTVCCDATIATEPTPWSD